MTWPVWCPTCRRPTDHASNGVLIRCLSCGHVRPDDVTVIAAPVLDMRFCPYCNEHKPVGHDCPAGAVGCENNQPEGSTCGACQPCYRAQAQGLAALDAPFQADPYGSPSDIDFP